MQSWKHSQNETIKILHHQVDELKTQISSMKSKQMERHNRAITLSVASGDRLQPNQSCDSFNFSNKASLNTTNSVIKQLKSQRVSNLSLQRRCSLHSSLETSRISGNFIREQPKMSIYRVTEEASQLPDSPEKQEEYQFIERISLPATPGYGSVSVRFHMHAKKLSMWKSYSESVTAMRVSDDFPLTYSNTIRSPHDDEITPSISFMRLGLHNCPSTLNNSNERIRFQPLQHDTTCHREVERQNSVLFFQRGNDSHSRSHKDDKSRSLSQDALSPLSCDYITTNEIME